MISRYAALVIRPFLIDRQKRLHRIPSPTPPRPRTGEGNPCGNAICRDKACLVRLEVPPSAAGEGFRVGGTTPSPPCQRANILKGAEQHGGHHVGGLCSRRDGIH